MDGLGWRHCYGPLFGNVTQTTTPDSSSGAVDGNATPPPSVRPVQADETGEGGDQP